MRVEHLLDARAVTRADLDATPGDVSGRWVNELGSVMELHRDGLDGTLRGTYRSGVRDHHVYDLVGHANATTVVFSVNFTASSSIGTWSGHHDRTTGRLEMLWHLVTEPHDSEHWNTTYAGFDTFTRPATLMA